jgi:hypothetical protein
MMDDRPQGRSGAGVGDSEALIDMRQFLKKAKKDWGYH